MQQQAQIESNAKKTSDIRNDARWINQKLNKMSYKVDVLTDKDPKYPVLVSFPNTLRADTKTKNCAQSSPKKPSS